MTKSASYLLMSAMVMMMSCCITINTTDDQAARFIRRTVAPSVYKAYIPIRGGGGTAFAVQTSKGNTVVVTNNHICRSSSTGTLDLKDSSGRTRLAKIRYRSTVTDLCIVDAPKGAVGLNMADEAPIGLRVRSVGHPSLMDVTLSEIGDLIQVSDATLGVDIDEDDPFAGLSCIGPNLKYNEYTDRDGDRVKTCRQYVRETFKSNFQVKPGNSGSPVVNSSGEVVGVVCGRDDDGWSISVTLKELKALVNNY